MIANAWIIQTWESSKHQLEEPLDCLIRGNIVSAGGDNG